MSAQAAPSGFDGPEKLVTIPVGEAKLAGGRIVVDRRRRAVAQAGQFIEDEGRPDDHRRVAREVERARLVPVQLARRRGFGDGLVEFQHLDGRGLVEAAANRRGPTGETPLARNTCSSTWLMKFSSTLVAATKPNISGGLCSASTRPVTLA
jgi:hypothetical protein